MLKGVSMSNDNLAAIKSMAAANQMVEGEGDPTIMLKALGANQVGETVQYDQGFEQARQYGQQAQDMMNNTLGTLASVGTGASMFKKRLNSMKSKTEQLVNGEDAEDDLPEGPGFNYLTHLFRRVGGPAKAEAKKKEAKTKGSNIYTDHMEALKVALSAMGVFSEKNPGGMPVDLLDAKKIWFGEDDP